MKRARHISHGIAAVLLASLALGATVQAQLIGEPPIPPKQKEKRSKSQRGDVEWMWQYSPPPEEGREHELIQDPHFQPFLRQYLTAPQSFWGLQTDRQRMTLAETAYDFLTIPGKVIADDNRYITATGSVFRFRSSRGLLFVDLNERDPLVVFAAIDWIRDSKTTDQPGAEYTLWIFADRPLGLGTSPNALPQPLKRSLTRWMLQPLPGSGIVQKITAAILVDPDGTPHQITVPTDFGR